MCFDSADENQKYFEYRNSLLETGLFHEYGRGTLLLLTGTRFLIAPTAKVLNLPMWRRSGGMPCDFEEVLELSPEEVKVKLLFHLDLFR